jgi:outer membrane protein assembly factor BamB
MPEEGVAMEQEEVALPLPSRASGFRLALLLLFVLASQGQGQEWTRFRGPNGSGISAAKTVPVQFSPGDVNWRIALPGVGHSSPVLWGKKIFVTSAEEDKGRRHVLCLNAADGKILWDRVYDFKPYRHHEFNSSASSTPTVDADRVYVTWSTPESVTVLALDHAGRELWKRDLGKLAIQHGGGASPIVVGDVVLLGVYQEEEGSEGFLIGLDRSSGRTLWKRPRATNGSASYATPMLYAPKDGPVEVVFTSTAHGMTSLDPKTGELNWEAPGLFSLRCVASPVLAGGLIFATAGEGGGGRQAVAVRPGSRQNRREPAVAYRLPRGPSYVPTPIVMEDRIFAWGDGGIVTCLKADTGAMVWQERVGDGSYFGSPVCINGKLYSVSAKGELVVIAASDQFKALGRSDLGEPSHATPAVADGVLYLRTLSHLISVGGKKLTAQ